MENSRPTACYFQRNSWKLLRYFYYTVITQKYLVHDMKQSFWTNYGLLKFTKKPDKWKKHSVSIIVLATFFGRNFSSSDFSFSQVTSVEKRESQQHFSASAYGLGLKKLCFGSLFSTSVTWEKLKSEEDKFFLRVGKHNYRNKILYALWKKRR